jgi:CheY-like chemotaxis protein
MKIDLKIAMTQEERIDALDFLISVLKEHEVSLNNITHRLEQLSLVLDEKYYDSELELEAEGVLTNIGSASKMPKILVIDDDPYILETIELILKNINYNVELASTGTQALNLIKKEDFDLVIIDINLPDIKGDEITRFIKERKKDTCIVLMTGYEPLLDDVIREKMDVEDILVKPIDPEDLIKLTKKSIIKRKRRSKG